MPNSWGAVGWEGYKPPTKTAPNPFETVTNAKSSQVDTRLSDLFSRWDELRGMGKSAVGDYSSVLNANTPRLTGFANQDISALDAIANGRTAADLEAMRKEKAAAIGQSADRARGQLTQTLSLNQLSQGGGGRALGSGSYIQKLAMNKLADINAKQAADNADTQRADYLYNQQLRLGALGQRGNYLDALAGRKLLPLQASNNEYGSALNQLQQLLQGYLGNNFIGLRKIGGVDYAAA
jgi:hypothetical protein